ncbi:DNA cytosine methyltransferase [Streptomyces rishiriensis]|uniref:DNA (cytosine-5-)-methyltransferase n=1 Tax=Streptomyces rishiriensis TaxID=68264 RepID=A0ABU0NRA2_STRRH|nr:DNA cytosine methyltransferase [Streptomyces rishiriensis]MDQ0581634.1 DNA (cytosine-5)-methyltransferase 1 [Streptomyces rishiriensis]
MSALRIGSVCTGYGGLDMAVQSVFGGELAWVADVDPGAARILAHHFPGVSNLGDITALDWRDVAPVDVLTGGYPCQPFSVAGRRKGTADERHIWPYIADALRVLRPRYAVFENVAGHLRLGFADVLADLARLGFDAEWLVVRADQVGAPHERRRLFLLAVAADAPHLGHQRRRNTRDGRTGPTHGRRAAADTDRAELARQPQERAGETPAAGHRRPAADAPRIGHRHAGPSCERGMATPSVSGGAAADPDVDWGRFAPAIGRWEAVTRRRAPWATDDRGRLSPAFVEWLMGLNLGHVTAVPGLSRTAQLKALGNGVVPVQASHALSVLRERLAHAPGRPHLQAA